MGLFDNVGNAAINQGGTYLNGGHQYLLEVLKVHNRRGRKGDDFFIAEFMIHESDDPKLGPGFKASWTANWKHDATISNVKWFLSSVWGIRPEDTATINQNITTQFCEFAVSDRNPLAGKMVEVAVVTIETKAKTPFSKHEWRPTQKAKNPNIAQLALVAASQQAAPPPNAQPAWVPPSAAPAPAFDPRAGFANLSQAPASFPQAGYQQAAPPSFPQAGYQQAAPPSFPQAAPFQPPVPPPPAYTPPAPTFPPEGWTPHPNAPGYFYRGTEVLTEQQLRAISV